MHFVSYLYPFIDRGHGPLFRWLMLMQMERMDADTVCFLGDSATFAEEGLPFDEECEVAGFVFRAPSRKRYREYRKYKLARGPFDRLLASSRGMLDAFRRMLTEDVPELRALIDTQLTRIQEKHPTCALMTWANCPALRKSAEARGIPVIHNELGPLRAPSFVPTVYFDFEGVNGATSAQRAASRHIDERKQLSLAALAPRIADMYVADNPAHAAGTEAEFEAAVALQVEDDSNVVAFSNGWSTAELMRFVVARHSSNRTLVRAHPGSVFRLASPALGRIDDSPDSLTFLQRARTLYTINSSVASEAAFFDKPFRVFGESPAAMLQKSAATKGARIRDARRAFYFLAYLVPARLAFDVTYYQWRLSRPSWEEIAERHLAVIGEEAARMRAEPGLGVQASPITAAPVWNEPDSADWLTGRSLSFQLRAMREQVAWLSHQHALWEQAAREHAQQIEHLRDTLSGATAERDELANEGRRVAALYRDACGELARVQAALRESESAVERAAEARSWIEGERDKWHQAALEAAARYAELEGKLEEAAEAAKWLEEQRSAWEKEAEARGEAAARREVEASEEVARLLAALRESESAVERAAEARSWIEGERDKWHQAALEAAARYAELEGKLEEAAEAAKWLEEQRSAWENEAQARGEASARREEEVSRLQDALRRAEVQLVAWERKASEQESELMSAQAEIRTLAEYRTVLERAAADYRLRVGDLEGRLSTALRGLRQRRHEVAVLVKNPVVRAALAVGLSRSRRQIKRTDKASER